MPRHLASLCSIVILAALVAGSRSSHFRLGDFDSSTRFAQQGVLALGSSLMSRGAQLTFQASEPLKGVSVTLEEDEDAFIIRVKNSGSRPAKLHAFGYASDLSHLDFKDIDVFLYQGAHRIAPPRFHCGFGYLGGYVELESGRSVALEVPFDGLGYRWLPVQESRVQAQVRLKGDTLYSNTIPLPSKIWKQVTKANLYGKAFRAESSL